MGHVRSWLPADVQPVLASLAVEGAKLGLGVVAEPVDQEWGERVASVAAPDGYVVHIGAPTG